MFGEKLSLSREMLSLLGVHYHFSLTSVHYVKSTKQILTGVRPPLPLFGSAYYANPSLIQLRIYQYNHPTIHLTVNPSILLPKEATNPMVLTRYHYTGDWSELSLVLGRPLEGLGRGAGQLTVRIERITMPLTFSRKIVKHRWHRRGGRSEQVADRCLVQLCQIPKPQWLARGHLARVQGTPLAAQVRIGGILGILGYAGKKHLS